jgi:hypothetical protein
MRASAPRRRMKRCHYDRSHPLEPRGPNGDRLIVTVRCPRSWVVEHSLLRSIASVTPRQEFIQLCDLVVPAGLSRNLELVQTALEDAGVIFIDADEEGPGVRLKANRAGQ